MMIGTLLGPERTTDALAWQMPAGGCCFSTRHNLGNIPVRSLAGFGVGVFCGVVGWSLVENCTVDASILFSVVKLSRANGGCLGTRSR